MARGGLVGGEEQVNHYGAVRLRVTGIGNLQMRLISLDDVRQDVLTPMPLTLTPGDEPTRLSNFTEQKSSFELKTTEIDEKFIIHKIIIFIKPVAESFPIVR